MKTIVATFGLTTMTRCGNKMFIEHTGNQGSTVANVAADINQLFGRKIFQDFEKIGHIYQDGTGNLYRDPSYHYILEMDYHKYLEVVGL
jgi:hypothetical protein